MPYTPTTTIRSTRWPKGHARGRHVESTTSRPFPFLLPDRSILFTIPFCLGFTRVPTSFPSKNLQLPKRSSIIRTIDVTWSIWHGSTIEQNPIDNRQRGWLQRDSQRGRRIIIKLTMMTLGECQYGRNYGLMYPNGWWWSTCDGSSCGRQGALRSRHLQEDVFFSCSPEEAATKDAITLKQ